MKPAANLILLTHKCGNHFFKSVFKKEASFVNYQSPDLKGTEMPGPDIEAILDKTATFLNIRCRNFDPISLKKIGGYIAQEKTHYFQCVRHPASFFRSASEYHLTTPERWSKNKSQQHLHGLTLHKALKEAHNLDERLIISMKHFGLAWRLPQRWVANVQYIESFGGHVKILKTEDLFSNGSSEYFKDLAKSMSHDSYVIDDQRLFNASPISMEKLPKHSTGEFKKEFFAGYGNTAKDFYQKYFAEIERYFYS